MPRPGASSLERMFPLFANVSIIHRLDSKSCNLWKAVWTQSKRPRGSASSALAGGPPTRIAGVHLRPPSIDRGVTSFLWAFGLGLFIWFGLAAVGVARPTAFILGVLSACAIFLFVRLSGD